MRSHRMLLLSVLSLIIFSVHWLHLISPTRLPSNIPIAEPESLPDAYIRPATPPIPQRISNIEDEPTVVEVKPARISWEANPGTRREGQQEVKVTPIELREGHPIPQLIQDAEDRRRKLQEGQSKTLKDAVAKYKRRFGISPPPHFDKWYDFAREQEIIFIDEFDEVHKALTPFWGLKPSTLRSRAREALGGDNNLLGIMIRNGTVANTFGGGEWISEALKGMLRNFVYFLPDMDLCFNLYDEPRVVLPYEDLNRLLSVAQAEMLSAASGVSSPRNSWSGRPDAIGDGTRIQSTMLTRFNELHHQAVWSQSRMSCPVESPARNLEDGPKIDKNETYAVTELGFIYNHTAFSNICESPSFSDTYGFFAGPNAISLTHDLFPIFSQSKISSYSDILYPSPWYWADKVIYNLTMDMPWSEKKDDIYWRGSTTGGFSHNGGWRQQHRQRLVQRANAKDQAGIFVSRNNFRKDSVKHPVSKDHADSLEGGPRARSPNDMIQTIFKEKRATAYEPAKLDFATNLRRSMTDQLAEGSSSPTFGESLQLSEDSAATASASTSKKPLGRSELDSISQTINSEAPAALSDPVSSPPTSKLTEDWQLTTVPRSNYKSLIDVAFSHVGQCDPGDCDAQHSYFDIALAADSQDAWAHKLLLDMDGNAFSGRFYALLKSNSLVLKLNIFREWHQEWIAPWASYIPLSMRGNEWLEVVRWFIVEDEGKREAERLATQSKEWAEKVLRKEDMEVWLFRLLLEYGRLVDDDREIIGYSP